LILVGTEATGHSSEAMRRVMRAPGWGRSWGASTPRRFLDGKLDAEDLDCPAFAAVLVLGTNLE
jgi:hypothetical protein